MPDLISCLKKNNLGPDCLFLGLKKGLFAPKQMLCHTAKDAWEIRKFNFLQLILRKIGFYRSSHLTHVCKKINATEITDELKSCHIRIQAFWEKKNLIESGNAPAAEAQLRGFAGIGNKCFRATTVFYINQFYKPGDIVLIPGGLAGQQCKNHKWSKGLNKNCIVQGWEPDNYEDIRKAAFKRGAQAQLELKKCLEFVQNEFPQEDCLTPARKILLDRNTKEFMTKVRQVNKYYKVKNIPKMEKGLIEIAEKYKNGTLAEKKHGVMFQYIALQVLNQLEKNYEKAFDKNMTAEEVKQIEKSFPQRNEQLNHEICKYLAEGRNVFVIAESPHLLKCNKVNDTFKQHKSLLVKKK